MTRLQDALSAAEAGIDAVGFIFHPQSPRYIDPEKARLVIDQLPPFINTVGVFVDKKRSEVEEIIEYCRLGYVQLHGEESPKYCERLARNSSPCQVIKAFRIGPQATAGDFEPYLPFVKGFLLDTYDKKLVGGTGRSFDWTIIQALMLKKPFILAGGLDPANVAAAIRTVGPSIIDVNSGVEKKPGVKDAKLIREFINAVRQAEQQAD